jgi:hypothetical protein
MSSKAIFINIKMNSRRVDRSNQPPPEPRKSGRRKHVEEEPEGMVSRSGKRYQRKEAEPSKRQRKKPVEEPEEEPVEEPKSRQKKKEQKKKKQPVPKALEDWWRNHLGGVEKKSSTGSSQRPTSSARRKLEK